MIYRGIGGTDGMAFSLATSPDGITWWKYPGNPVKRLGTGWDSYMIGSGSLLWIDGRFDLWYCGSNGYSWGIGVAMDEFAPLSVDASGSNAPGSVRLLQNFPNPFNPSTVIRYSLPARTHVTLAVFNTLGQGVASLVDAVEESGYHQVTFNATKLPSGMYLYRLSAGTAMQTKRLLLVR
jgi:hypothetical protein